MVIGQVEVVLGKRNVALHSASMIGENALEFKLEKCLMLMPMTVIDNFVLQSHASHLSCYWELSFKHKR